MAERLPCLFKGYSFFTKFLYFMNMPEPRAPGTKTAMVPHRTPTKGIKFLDTPSSEYSNDPTRYNNLFKPKEPA
jgi:hypothetical protein